MSRLLAAARGVLDHALGVAAGDPAATTVLRAHRDRLDGPLRVALAGTVKSGKSTLLNALVGERIAPTGTAECTRVATVYADAPTPRARLHPRGDGPVRELAVALEHGALVLDLAGTDPADVASLEVGWPSQHLRATTLVDTPGVDSATADAAGRARAFLLGGAGDGGRDPRGPGGADVVVHLVRHLHDPDVAFAEAFGDPAADAVGAGVGPAGTLVVLSRADEVGGGRADAVLAARQVARRYADDPGLRPWCVSVTAVAGLLAETARTLRGREFTDLRALAALARTDLDGLLVAADRFVRDDAGLVADGAVRAEDRLALLDRFGIFGLRTATTLLRRGVDDSATLAAELARRSGLDELQDLIATRLLARRDVLRARAALHAVDRLLRDGVRGPGVRGADPRALAHLAAELERVRTGAHAFVELDLLVALRGRAAVPVAGAVPGEAERLLGGSGPAAVDRLGLDPAAAPEEVHGVALETLARWRDLVEHPLTVRDDADVARVVVRSLEGLLGPGPRPAVGPPPGRSGPRPRPGPLPVP